MPRVKIKKCKSCGLKITIYYSDKTEICKYCADIENKKQIK